MEKQKVVYIGSMWRVSEYIYHNDKFELEAVICESDKISSELFTFTVVRNVELCKVENALDLLGHMKKYGEECIFVMCSYGKRVPMEMIESLKVFNIHYADLPYYKGRHPTYWATVCDEKRIGISIHIVTQKFDEGDIISQEYVPYYIWQNEEDLFEGLTLKIPYLLESLVKYLETGIVVRKNEEGNYYEPVGREETFVNIVTDSPALIYNKVRSQARVGGAKIELGSKVYRLKKILFVEKNIMEDYSIENNKMYIKYNEDITIIVTEYTEEVAV